jgi:hypothetical protein
MSSIAVLGQGVGYGVVSLYPIIHFINTRSVLDITELAMVLGAGDR